MKITCLKNLKWLKIVVSEMKNPDEDVDVELIVYE